MNLTLSFFAQFILVLFALWLLVVSYVAIFHPVKAKSHIEKFGSTPLIHFGEHVLRSIVGLAFLGAASATSYTLAFKLIGAVLIATSFLIMILPRRWHHAYAKYWGKTLSPMIVRLCGFLTIGAVALLVRALPLALT